MTNEKPATTAFDALYRERDTCVALAALLAQSLGLRTWVGQHESNSGHGLDGQDSKWDPEWLNVVYIELPEGQVSWHIHESELPLFARLPRGTTPWDGHTTDEKYARIRAYVSAAPRTAR